MDRCAADQQLQGADRQARGQAAAEHLPPDSERMMDPINMPCADESGLCCRMPRIWLPKIQRVGPGYQTWLVSTLLIALICPGAVADGFSITPASMARIGTVDERFQSYNIEMAEVTGGKFWKPYGPGLRRQPVRAATAVHAA